MNHDDHVRLIAPGIAHQGGTWADFGAGEGAFTLALRDLLGPESEIYALERDASSLQHLRQQMIRRFPETYLYLLEGDIRQPPDLPLLDGIVAANSLHYVERKRQPETLCRWNALLKPGGRIVLVEYDSIDPTYWLPHPVSFERLGKLTSEAGLPSAALLGTHPSRWGGGIYSAMISAGDRDTR